MGRKHTHTNTSIMLAVDKLFPAREPCLLAIKRVLSAQTGGTPGGFKYSYNENTETKVPGSAENLHSYRYIFAVLYAYLFDL